MTTLTDEAIGPISLQKRKFIENSLFLLFFKTTQFLTWPIAFIFFSLLFKIKINGRLQFDSLKSPFIIISNHISFYDSFLFRLILGFSTSHLPLRFMAVDRFNWWYLNFLSELGVVNFVYHFFGVFTVTPGEGIEKNLKKAVDIINNGGNIVMYPEGQISTTGEINTFKIGTAILAKKTGAPVIPLSFKIKRNVLSRNELFINIGMPIYNDAQASPEELTNIYQETVSDLYRNASV